MNRWVLLAGLLVAVFALYQFGAERMTVNDVFQSLEIEEEAAVPAAEILPGKISVEYFPAALVQAQPYENSVAGLKNVELFADKPRGAVVPKVWVDLMENAEFFVRLQKTRDVDTFVVLIENVDFSSASDVALSKKGYETPFGKLEPDMLMIEDLLKLDGVGVFDLAFAEERGVKHIAAYLKMLFPEATIVAVAIKSGADETVLTGLTETLAEYDSEDVMVLAASSLSNDGFDRELYSTVFETFDKADNVVLRVLMDYLSEIEAQEFEFIGDMAVNFYDGSARSDERKLTVLAFGDMMLGRYVRTLMDEHGKDYIFAGLDRNFFEGADIVTANLEGPIKGDGRKGGTSMVFSFNEDIAPFLKSYGFDLFSISNNHATDQGWDGRDTTIAALDSAGLKWCGHPSEADPDSVYYGKVGEKSYAFLCFHDVTYKLDDSAAVDLVRDVAAKTDYVLVSIHWGYEYKHQPDKTTQIEPARAFIDAGADFVIGHHPHVVQTFEVYKDKLIFYSLGNFVFDQFWSKDTQEELAIGIALGEKTTRVHLFPMKSERAQPRLMTEEELTEWTERFIGYGDYSAEMQKMIREGVIQVGE